jgi:hypothetical protein
MINNEEATAAAKRKGSNVGHHYATARRELQAVYSDEILNATPRSS